MAFRKGSDGAADEKQDKIILIVVAVATMLLWCAIFVFDTDLKLFAGRATKLANIGGSLLIFGSWFYLLIGQRNKWEGKAIIGWLLLLAFGVVLSCGFNFDYFGLK